MGISRKSWMLFCRSFRRFFMNIFVQEKFQLNECHTISWKPECWLGWNSAKRCCTNSKAVTLGTLWWWAMKPGWISMMLKQSTSFPFGSCLKRSHGRRWNGRDESKGKWRQPFSQPVGTCPWLLWKTKSTVRGQWYTKCLLVVFKNIWDRRPRTGLRQVLLHHDHALALSANTMLSFLEGTPVILVTHSPCGPGGSLVPVPDEETITAQIVISNTRRCYHSLPAGLKCSVLYPAGQCFQDWIWKVGCV